MQEARPGPAKRLVRVQTVRGEPYDVRGRRLVPVARMVSVGKGRASIGTHRLGGWGWGLASITPLAVIEETPRGERRLAIRDGTAKALAGIYLAVVGFTLFFTAVRWLARR